jgi:uncharacterized repeat protein (TIGR01451 family)
MWTTAIAIATVAGSLALPAAAAQADDATDDASVDAGPGIVDGDIVAPVPPGFLAVPGQPDSIMDTAGNVFQLEQTEVSPAPAALAPPAPFPVADTFRLHSRAGSTRIIYLDFDGYASAAETDLGYDIDGSPDSFGPVEIDVIQEVWARVAEFYVTFDVDVTTEDPGTDALLDDFVVGDTSGSRVLITNGPVSGNQLTTICYQSTTCAGLAWVSAFGRLDPVAMVKSGPAMGLGADARALALVAAHEAGHTLGLQHQSQPAGLMAAVMNAVLTYRPIQQWSSTAQQDDVARIGNFLTLWPDDHGSSLAAATVVDASAISGRGIISNQDDVDSFRFDVPSVAGPLTLTVAPVAANRSLDIDATLLDASGTVVASSNPPATYVDDDTASGRDASFSALTLSPGTYQLSIRGSDGTGYTAYGSIGSYTITGGLQAVPCSIGSYSTTGNAPCDAAPAGFFVDHPGATSAAPCPPGTYASTEGSAMCSTTPTGTYAVGAADRPTPCPPGTTTAAPGATSIDDCYGLPALSGTPGDGVIGTPYSFTFGTGGTPAPTLSAPADDLPPGLTLSPSGVLSGVPTQAGAFTFTVTAANGHLPAATTTVTVHIERLPQDIVFDMPPSPALVGGSFTPSITATSGLPVTVSIESVSASVCTLSPAGVVRFVGVGTCVISADQAGNDQYAPALRASEYITVLAVPTITATSAPLSVDAGQLYTATFAVTGTPTPTIYLPDGTPSWLTLGAGGTVSGTPPAGTTSFTYSVRAQSEVGDVVAGPFTVTVVRLGQTVSFDSASPSPAVVGGTYTPAATATSGLAVTFSIDAGSAGVCTITGGVVSLVAPGMCTVVADQAGDDRYAPAPRVLQFFSVLQAPSFAPASPAVTVNAGSLYTASFTATGTPTPTLALASGAPSWLSIGADGTVAGTPPSGTTSFTFSLVASSPAGDASVGPFTVTVVRNAQSISFGSTPPSPALVSGTYSPGASATSGLPVTLSIDPASVDVCTISAGIVSFIGVGTCVIEADQIGNADWQAAPPVQQTVAVLLAPTFTLASPPLTATVGQPYTYDVEATGTPTPTIALVGAPSWLSIDASGTVSGTPPVGTTSFTYSVRASSAAGTTTAGPFAVTVTAPPTTSTKADLAIGLTCPSTARRNTTISCTVTVRNNGPAIAKNVVTSLVLPCGATVVSSATAPTTTFRGLLVWKTASLASGSTLTFTVTYRTGVVGRQRIGAGTISSNPDPKLGNNGVVVTQTITR